MVLLGGTVRRWIALVSFAATVAGIVGFAATEHLKWAWFAIVGLALLVASFAWTAYDERQKRLVAEDRPHIPPGDGVPLYSPVEYQVKALRQAIPKLAEAGLTTFGEWEVEETLKNLPRRGVDPVYEPLRSVDAGLARLAELGELEKTQNGAWRII
jgi:hypothetical protein